MTAEPDAASVAEADWFKRPELATVLTLLNGIGEARVVGGAVRNTLMGLPVKDIDIATTLRPDVVMDQALKAGVKCVPTGIDHGTVTLVVDGQPFEVTTLRVDVKTDGRHAQVAFGNGWGADARRRDLTMNGLYADATGRVIDLVGGVPDIHSGTVRFIGDAAKRIEEDYLRILRFFRFFAWYGRGRPDADGLRACVRHKGGLVRLSAERVWSELKRLLSAPDPSRALLWMRQTGILTAVLPESEKWGIDAIPSLIDTEKAMGWAPDFLLRLMAMVPPEAARVTDMAQRMRLSNNESKRLVAWANQSEPASDASDPDVRRLLYLGDPVAMADRLKLRLASRRAHVESDTRALEDVATLLRQLSVAEGFVRPRFPVSGGDLIALGMTPGQDLGEALARLEALWAESDFALDRDTLLSHLQDD